MPHNGQRHRRLRNRRYHSGRLFDRCGIGRTSSQVGKKNRAGDALGLVLPLFSSLSSSA